MWILVELRPENFNSVLFFFWSCKWNSFKATRSSKGTSDKPLHQCTIFISQILCHCVIVWTTYSSRGTKAAAPLYTRYVWALWNSLEVYSLLSFVNNSLQLVILYLVTFPGMPKMLYSPAFCFIYHGKIHLFHFKKVIWLCFI